MDIHLIRDRLSLDGPTMGQLHADGRTFQTLEDAWKDNQRNVSCIPPGRYRINFGWSDKFDRLVLWLRDVPNRSAIEIHSGNREEDITGCILVGLYRGEDGRSVIASRRAVDLLYKIVGRALRTEDVYCEVSYVS